MNKTKLIFHEGFIGKRKAMEEVKKRFSGISECFIMERNDISRWNTVLNTKLEVNVYVCIWKRNHVSKTRRTPINIVSTSMIIVLSHQLNNSIISFRKKKVNKILKNILRKYFTKI